MGICVSIEIYGDVYETPVSVKKTMNGECVALVGGKPCSTEMPIYDKKLNLCYTHFCVNAIHNAAIELSE